MFNKQDKVMAENLARALKKGKFELEGMEVLALAQSMEWVGQLIRKIEQDLQPIPAPSQPVAPVEEPVKKTRKRKDA